MNPHEPLDHGADRGLDALFGGLCRDAHGTLHAAPPRFRDALYPLPSFRWTAAATDGLPLNFPAPAAAADGLRRALYQRVVYAP